MFVGEEDVFDIWTAEKIGGDLSLERQRGSREEPVRRHAGIRVDLVAVKILRGDA